MAVELELPAVYLDALVLDPATTRLVPINRDPEPGDTDVPLDVAISFDLIDVGPDGIDVAATEVYVGGALAYRGGVFSPGYDNARSAAALPAPDTLRLTLGPLVPFHSLQAVEVRVVARTRGAGAALDTTWTFTCVDRTGPRLVGAQARDLRRIRLSFDEPIPQVDPRAAGDALNPTSYTLTRQSGPAVDATIIAVETVTSSAVDLLTSDVLTPAASYQLVVDAVADTHGNPIAPPDNVAVFAAFMPPRPAGRQFSLYALLPELNRREDLTGDLLRFLACLQEVTDLVLSDIDHFTDILDPDLAPEPVLDLMLGELGNPFLFELNEVDKRRLLNVLVEIYREKGTAVGITNAVRFFLGLEVELIAYAGEGLVLGEARLGEDWILGPSGAFAAFAFEIVAPRALEPEERRRLRQIVEYMKPAHTHFVRLVEPAIPEIVDHLELGLSDLGQTWVLH